VIFGKKMIPKRIAFFGSSSVHGYGDTEMGGFVHRFRLWHEGQRPGNIVYQLGVFGETTASLTARIAAEGRPRRPHLIVLYPGFNDLRKKGGPEGENLVSLVEYQELVTQLLKAAIEIAPTIVMTGLPFDDSKTTPLKGTKLFYLSCEAERYTEKVREACRESQVPVLDCFLLWQSLNRNTLLAEDGLHASPDGHRVLFEQVRDFIVSKYQVKWGR